MKSSLNMPVVLWTWVQVLLGQETQVPNNAPVPLLFLFTWHEFVISCECMHWILSVLFCPEQRKQRSEPAGWSIKNAKALSEIEWLNSIRTLSSKWSTLCFYWFFLFCLQWKLHVTIKISFGETNVHGPSGAVDSSLSAVFWTDSPGDPFLVLPVTSLCPTHHRCMSCAKDSLGPSGGLGCGPTLANYPLRCLNL